MGNILVGLIVAAALFYLIRIYPQKCSRSPGKAIKLQLCWNVMCNTQDCLMQVSTSSSFLLLLFKAVLKYGNRSGMPRA